MNRQSILVTLTCALVWMLGASTRGESDSYFRRDGGVADDDKRSLPEQFDSKKGFLWRQELPRGNSTPCVHGDFVFLTTHQDQELATVCLDRLTGKVRWKRVIPTSKLEPFHRVGSPASCTPACDGKRRAILMVRDKDEKRKVLGGPELENIVLDTDILKMLRWKLLVIVQ